MIILMLKLSYLLFILFHEEINIFNFIIMLVYRNNNKISRTSTYLVS